MSDLREEIERVIELAPGWTGTRREVQDLASKIIRTAAEHRSQIPQTFAAMIYKDDPRRHGRRGFR